MAEINCIINQTMLMSKPTKKIHLQEPLAYTNGQAHAMRVTVFNDDGSEMDLTGVSVSGNFVKADGNSVSPLTGTVSANTAEVLLTPSCYVVPGRFKFTMDLVIPNGATRTALWVEGMVEKNISGEITDPGTPVGNIAQAVAAANAAAQTAQGAMAQIGLSVNATPSTIPGVRVGWVPVTLDKTNAEVIQAAQSGKCVVNLPLYGETIICHQAERSGNSIYFIGINVDNSALFVYAVLINASSAQAALLGSLAMTDLMPQSGNG